MSHTFEELRPGQVFTSSHGSPDRYVKLDAGRYRTAARQVGGRVPVEDRTTYRATNRSMFVLPCGSEKLE